MKGRILRVGTLMVALTLGGCGGAGIAGPDTGVTVTSTFPLDNAAQVRQNVEVSITFSDDMDPYTVDAGTFTLDESTRAGAAPVHGRIHTAGRHATFSPDRPLKPFTTYVATVTRGIHCEDGGGMSNDYSWTFVTGATLDTTPPTVADTAFGVQVQADGLHEPVFVAVFSEVMDPISVNDQSIALADPSGTAVPLRVQYVGISALIYPTAPLAPDSSYTVTVSTGVTDIAGNHMREPRVWTVQTPNLATLTGESAPTVVTTSPGHDADGTLLGTEITATFSENMDPTTLTNTSFLVYAPGRVPVAGTVTLSGVSASFVPNDLLAPETTYVVDIEPAAKDLEGTPLAAEYEWTFTTGQDVAGTPPVVQFTTPTPDDSGVALDKSILVAFNEPMDPSTVTTSTFMVNAEDGTPLQGMVTYTGLTAVFTPDQALLPDVRYTARITTGATDAGGEPMAADYVWSFSTGADIADTTPQVLFTNPESGEVGLPYDGLQIQIAFSEVMDPRTINAQNIVVTAPDGSVVPGTFTYLAYAAYFTPSVPLDQFSVYTITVSTGVKDLEGAPLAQNYSWWFSTNGSM